MLTEREIRAAMAASAVRMPLADTAARPEAAGGPSDELLSSAQRAQIGRVLKQAGSNKTEAARLLGISRRSLYRWMDRLNLTEARPRVPDQT
jgi:transcriptional regulator with PAS, ATPase and Fis domain